MTDFNNIDDLFKESQGDWNEMPSNKAWDKLSDRLGIHAVQKDNANKIIIRWAIVASVVVILGLSYFFLNISPTNYDGQLAATEKVNAPEDVTKTYPKEAEQEATETNSNTFKGNAATDVKEEPTMEAIKSRSTNSIPADHSKTQTINSSKPTNANIAAQQFNNKSESNIDKDGFSNNADETSYMEEDFPPQYAEEIIESDENVNQNNLKDELLLDREQTVVANYIGIQKEKAERASSAKQKKESDQAAPRAASAYESEEKSQGFINERDSDEVGYSVNEETISLKYSGADAVSDKIVYIYYPIDKASCDQVIFQLMSDKAILYNCENSNDSTILTSNKTLTKLYNLPISDYHEIEFEKVYEDCLSDLPSSSIKIVIVYGLKNDPSNDTYFWNVDCSTNSNAIFIKELEKLVKNLN